ncbi:VOC family protein [Flavobacterium caeni]|uniref:PhnB protein n=1 Tax=Flavobacterium caeni TaxID=490189 RepID=A0A1G5JHG5_9FLAO|nr:VOC family protein [Flavobacterium caeni]SCY87604.1 PhnB protein [Flavobacterium caeni]
MAQINPYLTFNGNCAEAFDFYKSVFGGEFAHIGKFKDMPSEQTLPEEVGNLIMHVSLPISSDTTLMGSDANEMFGQTAQFGSNVSISINTASEAEAQRLFNGLSSGGKITMPLDKTFWGAYFGMFTDQFGVHWMVNYDYEQK